MHPVPTGRRVLVVSASMGAGHSHAAAELTRRLTARGHVAREVDLLAMASFGQGRALRGFYAALVRRAPSAYDAAMRGWARWPGAFERLTGAGAGSYQRGLLREVRTFEPDVVVATFNLAAQALGRLRRDGALDQPLLTYVTDPGAHPYWVDRDVDHHLAVTALTARDLQALGASGVVTVSPLVSPRFQHAPTKDRARAGWGLADDAVVALVTAGSWGVGQIERCVHDVSRAGAVPVVMCGRNAGLRRRVRATGVARAVGWTDQVPALMAAADVLVDNAGGLTCLQALVSGLPVVSYRPIPGHGRLNARALAGAGLAYLAHDRRDLREGISQLATPGRSRTLAVTRGRLLAAAGDPADEVLGATAQGGPSYTDHDYLGAAAQPVEGFG